MSNRMALDHALPVCGTPTQAPRQSSYKSVRRYRQLDTQCMSTTNSGRSTCSLQRRLASVHLPAADSSGLPEVTLE